MGGWPIRRGEAEPRQANEVMVIIELYKEAISKTDILDEVLKDNIICAKLEKGTAWNSYFKQYLFKTYQLGIDDLEKPGDFLYQKIQEDFKPLWILY